MYKIKKKHSFFLYFCFQTTIAVLPQKWREKEHGSEEEVDDRDGGERDEPEPEDEEDLVVDDVEAEDAHGVVDVEVARQRAGGKLAPACPK